MSTATRSRTRAPASTSAFDAIVVGRGAVGAAAALGLAQSGLRTAIVAPDAPRRTAPDAPRHAAPARGTATAPAGSEREHWDARVFALSPASRALLERLRLWDALDSTRVAPVHEMRVYPDAAPDAPQLRFDAYEACVDALAWIVEGENLSGALERALGFAGVTSFDARLAAIDTSTEGASAAITLDDGAELHAKLVVGADGASSPLRAAVGIDASERDYPQRAVVANFATGGPHRDRAFQWFGAHGILALLPLPGDRVSIVWSAPLPLAQTLLECDPQEFARHVDEVSQCALGPLRLITAPRSFPLRMLEVERTIGPRVALVGDAAHVVHPLAGQGMNLGFGDVQALLDVVRDREPFRDPGDHLLLRRYERARAEAVAAMHIATDGLQRLFDPESDPALPALMRPILGARELGWRLVESSPWLKRRLVAHAAS